MHASISRDGFHVKVANRAVRITQERGGQYHLSAYGAIENIRLGQFQPRAASSYSLSGTLIGYSEDEVRLLVAAKEHLEQQRQTFIESLKQHIRVSGHGTGGALTVPESCRKNRDSHYT